MRDIESLLSENELLKLKVSSSETLIKREQDLRLFYESEYARLLEQLRLVKIQVYGRKSERWESEEQIRLFNEAESLEAQKAKDDDEENPTVNVKGHTKKRGKRGPLPKNLLREIIR